MPVTSHRAADKAIQKKLGLRRSPAWPKVEKAFRTAHPKCVACGGTTQLNVHHKFPFHYVVLCGRPDLELDTRNLMTLCIRQNHQHHILLGHLDDYESYNPRAVTFVKTCFGQNTMEIRAKAAWQKARTARPKHVDQMTTVEMAAFKKKLDRKFPMKQALLVKAVLARAGLINTKRAANVAE